MPRDYTPTVRAEAKALGVALDTVTGTGAGGRVRLSDVRAAAGLSPRPTPARRSTAATTPPGPAALPPFTASGIDPQALLQVPEVVRPALAAEESRAIAYELVQTYRGLDNDTATATLLRDDRIPHQHRLQARHAEYLEQRRQDNTSRSVTLSDLRQTP